MVLVHVFVMHKPRIWTVLGMSCTNFRFNKVNVPELLSSLAKHVPCLSEVRIYDSLINYVHKLTMQVRARESDRASAKAKVMGKEQAKERAMGPELRPELGLDR